MREMRKIFLIISILSWIISIIPFFYVVYQAINSMNGTLHGFNGVELHGIEAFFDIIFMYITFFFPIFLLWLITVVFSLITTIIYLLSYRK